MNTKACCSSKREGRGRPRFNLGRETLLSITLMVSTLHAASNETIVAWGNNDQDQCVAPASLGGPDDVAALAGGVYHSLALKTDGTVVGWGGIWGREEMPEGLSNVVAIAAGKNHNLALDAHGVVTAWGSDSYLQCTWVDGMSNVVAIAAARAHSVVAQSNGTVTARGQYVSYTEDEDDVVALASGYAHDLALKSDGTVVALRGGSMRAAVVPEDLEEVMAIAVSDSQSLALRSNGTVVVWGEGAYPTGLTNIVAIAAKAGHGLALRANGTVVTWGSDYYGEDVVPEGLSNVVAIATGDYHNLALRELPVETAPVLLIARSLSGVTLSWESDSLDWVLRSCDNLLSNTWADVVSGTNNPAVVPAAAPAAFYRLVKP